MPTQHYLRCSRRETISLQRMGAAIYFLPRAGTREVRRRGRSQLHPRETHGAWLLHSVPALGFTDQGEDPLNGCLKKT